MEFDDALVRINGFGPYQRRATLIVCACQIIVACHTLGPVFIAYTPSHWCQTPDVAPHTNCTPEQLRELTVPKTDNGEYESCTRYKRNYSSITNQDKCDVVTNSTVLDQVSCDAWHFDRSQLIETTVTEFTLVCDRRGLPATIASTYLAAHALGIICFGPLADKFGRWKLFFFGNVSGFIFSMASTFAPNYLVFMILRMLVAFSFTAEGVSALIIVLEFTSPNYRVVCACAMGSMWAIAPQIFALIAYLVKSWRYINFIITAPHILLIFIFYFCIKESARWLIVQGRNEEANEIIEYVAKMNGRHWDKDNKLYVKEEKSQSLIQLLKVPTFFYLISVLILMWFTCGFVYYSITFGSPNMGYNPYLSFVIAGALELPAKISTLTIMGFIGRVYPICTLYLLCGSALLGLVLSPDIYWLKIGLTMCAKGLIASCFTAIWIYTSELFPTSVRSSASSVVYIFSSIGAILGSYIWELKKVYIHLPVIICGMAAILSGIFVLSLPETKTVKLTQTIAEGKQFLKENLFWYEIF